MVKFKGIHVTVQVAGVDLKEYEDEDEGSYNPGKVSRYVEAVSGAAFAVRIRVPKNYRMNSNALSFYISADGMKGHHPLMDRANPNFAGQQGWVSLTTGVKSFVHGRWEEREWHFSDIHLSKPMSNSLNAKSLNRSLRRGAHPWKFSARHSRRDHHPWVDHCQCPPLERTWTKVGSRNSRQNESR